MYRAYHTREDKSSRLLLCNTEMSDDLLMETFLLAYNLRDLAGAQLVIPLQG